MRPKNLSELLPPLPSLSELEQSAAAEEALHSAAQTASGSAPEGATRKVEVVTLTDEEFEATLRGAVSTSHTGLSTSQAAAKAVAVAAGDAPSAGSQPPTPAPENAPTEPSHFDEGYLRCYAAAAALRYTYLLDALSPLPLESAPVPDRLQSYKELGSAEREAVFVYLTGRSEIVKDARGLSRWALRDDERRKALKALLEGGKVSEAIAQARADVADEARRNAKAGTPGEEAAEDARDGTSRVEEVLWNYLTGPPPPLEQQDSRELLMSQRVVSWLHNLTPDLQVPTPEQVTQQLTRETLLQPFRHLTGEWKNGVFVSYFKGREQELKYLYDYLSVLPPDSLRHRLSRAVASFVGSAWSYFTGSAANRPLLIHGPGGVGKSTLLAKFLLDHLTEVKPTDRFPYAYLDFDVSALNVSEPVTLIAEAARQLSAQYPAQRPEWEDARANWLKAVSASWPLELEPQQRVEALRRFAELLRKSESEETRVEEQFKRGLPFLLVMDTFEEVQYHDRDAVRHVFRFLNEFREHVPTLRVVLMGRAPLKDVRAEYAGLESIAVESDTFGTGAATDFNVAEVELGDLQDAKAREYLQEQGVADPELAEDLIEVVGGNPLSLRLVARVLREGEVNPGSLREEMEWRPSLSDRLLGRKVPPKALLQGVLFRRILGHIHDEKIRDLAHPGLVLRRITPDLIKKVLAEPCGLGTLNDQEAQTLFDALAREVSLVGTDTDTEGASVLKHRVELRRIMLKLMEADEEKQDQIHQVHVNAVDYYSKGKEQSERVEALYHRLMLGDLPRPDGLLDDVPTEEAVEAGYAAAPSPEDDPRPVWRVVADAAGELPASANTFLAARLHREMVPDAAWETADPRDWELMMLCRASRRARVHASVVSALETLRLDRARTKRTKGRQEQLSPLPLMEIALLERLGEYDEVEKHVQTTLKQLRPALKASPPGEEIFARRRVVEYNLLAARAAALKGKSGYEKYLIEAFSICTEVYRPGEPSPTIQRSLRQVLRFTADCHLHAPSAKVIDLLGPVIEAFIKYADTLKLTPTLARYAVSTIYSEASEKVSPYTLEQPSFVWEAEKPVLSVLLTQVPRPTVTRVAEALARWTMEVLKTSDGVKLLEALGRPQIPRETFAMRRYWSQHLLSEPPDKVAHMLTSLHAVTPIPSARMIDLCRALTPERGEGGEDPFEDARRAGDLIPGEGTPADAKASARKAKRKS